jgi:hypothetical protein
MEKLLDLLNYLIKRKYSLPQEFWVVEDKMAFPIYLSLFMGSKSISIPHYQIKSVILTGEGPVDWKKQLKKSYCHFLVFLEDGSIQEVDI